MAEEKKEDKDKNDVEKLKADYGAEDMGTYMDARVDGKPVRVAVWNEGLKSFQPTDEGRDLLTKPKPEKPKEPAAKPAAKPAAGAGIATPVPPAPPPGQGPTATPPPPGTKPA